MTTLNVNALRQAITSGSNKLFNNKERIDALNIFPVPDGDTGSNMSSTIQKATEAVQKNKYESIAEFITDFSKNMLLFARGNSGVILSQIFKGFSNSWNSNKTQELKISEIIQGFASATKTAYESVLKPVEGTILTVIRETSEALSKLEISKNTKIADVFKKAVEAARKSVDNTPKLLPILKEAGVVDSGGEGLVTVLEGMTSFFEGKFIDIDLESTRPFMTINNYEIYNGEFGYCTELIIKIKDLAKFNKAKFISNAEKLGNSMVVVDDDDILKIHIHTIKPSKVLELGQKLGEFLAVKIENMTQQANNTKSNVEGIKKTMKSKQKAPQKNSAIISCNAGIGFINTMKEYDCDYVIEGRQSNNPSTQDIVEAITAVNAKNIFILPNNKNVILTAQQAAKIKSEFNIHIISTKTQVEGITAILNYSSELEVKDNLKEMEKALKNLMVGAVTAASKDATVDGVKVKEGSFLMICNEKIIDTKKTLIDASKKLVDKMISSRKRSDLLVIYYGINSSNQEAKEIEKYVLNKHDVEVQIQEGSQTTYDLMFGLE